MENELKNIWVSKKVEKIDQLRKGEVSNENT